MIVERMKERQMQDRRQFGLLVEANRMAADRVFVSLRPAVAAGHQLHAIRPEHMQLAHRAVERHRFDVRIPRQQHVRIDRLEQCRAVLPRVGTRQQGSDGMRVMLLRALEHQEGAGRRVLRN